MLPKAMMVLMTHMASQLDVSKSDSKLDTYNGLKSYSFTHRLERAQAFDYALTRSCDCVSCDCECT